MNLLLISAIFLSVFYNAVGAIPTPDGLADGLTFCCTENDDGKNPETAERIQNPPGGNTSLRISHRKCLEYSGLFCLEPEYPVFGVIGGTDVQKAGEVPHMVALGWRQENGAGFLWLCGGSLISDLYILTAAHCTYSRNAGLVSPTPELVRLGELDFTKDSTELQDILIQSITIHPEYKSPSKYHDIALLKLATPARINQLIRPVCLWQNDSMEQKVAKATGWGKTSVVGSGSVILQTVDLSFFSNEQCRQSFGETRTMRRGIIPQQLCAGDARGGKDTCSGDSGGPLTINLPTNALEDCVHHQVGVTSFGVGCGSTLPAVYTRVSHYLDWIERIVWP